MSKTIVALLTITVLLTSVAVMTIPSAHALTKGTEFRMYRSASWGNDIVCGDHICAPGEKTTWLNALANSQKTTAGKTSTSLGEDVIKNMVTETPKSSDSSKMNSEMKMPETPKKTPGNK